jgi:hypothetical protein
LGFLHSVNQVFKEDAFNELADELRAKAREGESAICTQTLEVLDNLRWGIVGGWQVKVTWFYLSPDIGELV